MTESRKIAEFLHEFECGGTLEEKRKKMKICRERLKITDDICATQSDDYMSWYIFKSYDDQVRKFCKVVPCFQLDACILEDIIAAQPWVCL